MSGKVFISLLTYLLRSVDRVDRAERTRMLIREPIRSRDSSKDRRRILPSVPASDETSSAIRDVTSQLTRMTSSVNSIAASESPPLESRSSATDRDRTSSVRYRHYVQINMSDVMAGLLENNDYLRVCCEQVLFLAASVCLSVCLSVRLSLRTKSRKLLVRN